MKYLLGSVAWVALLVGTPVVAQNPQRAGPQAAEDFILPQTAASPRSHSSDRYVTAQQLIFRRAAMEAAQRQARIEALRWFGFDPSRPPVTPVPAMGSPTFYPTPILIDSPWMIFTHRPDMGY